MKRIALALFPVLTLAACGELPTAADHTDESAPVVQLSADLEVIKVNLAEATALQILLASESRLPVAAVLDNTDNGVSAGLMHTFDVGCPNHYQDVDGDGVVDLILHFDPSVLFGSYDTDALPADPLLLELTVTFEDEEITGEYWVQLAYKVPHRWKGKPTGR